MLWEVGLITEQEFQAACENELAEELEENPDAEQAAFFGFVSQPQPRGAFRPRLFQTRKSRRPGTAIVVLADCPSTVILLL